MKVLLCGLIALFLASCATVPPGCEAEKAAKDGFSTAMQGKRDYHHAGEICDEEYREAYKKNFEEGYTRGLARYCDVTQMEDVGRGRGESGDATAFDKAAYQVCPNLTAMETFFKLGLRQGLADYCEAPAAESAGQAYGSRGRENNFPAAHYQVCGADNLGMIKAAYQRGYDRGLKAYCAQATGLDAQAFIDGRNGSDKADIVNHYGRCPAPQREWIQGIYEDAYNKGLAGFCAPTAVENEARDQARTASATDALPDKFHRCLGRFPQVTDEYSAAFKAARQGGN